MYIFICIYIYMYIFIPYIYLNGLFMAYEYLLSLIACMHLLNVIPFQANKLF